MRKHHAHEFSQGQYALFTPFIVVPQTSESNLSSVAFCMKHTFLTRLAYIFLHFLSVMNVNHEHFRLLNWIVSISLLLFVLPIPYARFKFFSNVCSLVKHFEGGFVYLLSIYASDVWVLKNLASLGWLTTVYPTNILKLHKVYISSLLCNSGKWRLVF